MFVQYSSWYIHYREGLKIGYNTRVPRLAGLDNCVAGKVHHRSSREEGASEMLGATPTKACVMIGTVPLQRRVCERVCGYYGVYR